jgi:hypothetical protein
MKKELQKVAMEIARLEKEFNQGNAKETEDKINNLISKLSLEEILEIDNYILEQKLL